MGCPRCELVEEKKSNPIGRSQWNTWGGNRENFIRDTPPGWHDLFKEEHRRTAVMQQNHQEADESKDDPNSK